MRIAICGSPRSGKTVLINWIMSHLPAEGVVTVAANPDNEGLWSGNRGTFQAKITRISGTFSKGFMEDVDIAIGCHDERIVFVDLGGKLDRKKDKKKKEEEIEDLTEENAVLTKENLHILRRCDAYIVVSKKLEGRPGQTGDIWRVCMQGVRGRNGQPLRYIGQIESSMDPKELDELSIGPKREHFVGRIHHLKRGNRPIDRETLVLRKLARCLLTLTADEGRKKGEEEERRKEEDSKNGISEIDGLSFMQFLADLGLVEESRVAEDPTEYNRRVMIPKRHFHLFEKYLEGLQLTDHVRIGRYMTGQAVIALCCALKNLEAKTGVKRNIEIFDKKYNQYGPLLQIPEAKGITYMALRDKSVHTYLIESKKAVFLNVDIFGRDISIEDLRQIQMPEVNDDKVLYLSGQIPYYMLASLCLSSGAKRIYTFTPGAGFTCVISPDKKEIGRVVGRSDVRIEDVGPGEDSKADLWLDGINVGRFLLDRFRGNIQDKSYMYVEEDERTKDELLDMQREEFLEATDKKLQKESEMEPLIPAFSRVGHGKAHAMKNGYLPGRERKKHAFRLLETKRITSIKRIRRQPEDQGEE